jgi:hypothetical protein
MASNAQHSAFQRLASDLQIDGATAKLACDVVTALRDAGLTAGQARKWLSNRGSGYLIWMPGVAWRQVATTVIAADHGEIVLAAAREYLRASPTERELARAIQCDIAAVRRLTQHDPERASTMVEIIRLLRAQLTDGQVYDALHTLPNFDPDTGEAGERMLDRMHDGHEHDVLTEVRDGTIDPQDLFRSGMLRPSWVPGDPGNPYGA